MGSVSLEKRLKEEPLVAVGTAATIAAFIYASVGIYRGRFKQSQWGMRGRVILQGLTVATLAGYAFVRNRNAERARKEDIRPINWERLEREAKAAEEQAKKEKTSSILKALEKTESVFVKSPSSEQDGKSSNV